MEWHTENQKPKFCKHCNKPEGEVVFHTRLNNRGKRYWNLQCSTCKSRVNNAAKKRRLAKMRIEEPEKYYRLRRHEQLRSIYRIGLEDYESLLKKQGGGCAICGTKDSGKYTFAVDHCHETKKVRGILCHWCNKGLGQFYDNPENLRKAADYLDGHTLSSA